MKVNDLKIGARLGVSFGAITLLLIVLAALALQREMLDSVNRRTVVVLDLLLADPAPTPLAVSAFRFAADAAGIAGAAPDPTPVIAA